MPLVYHSSIWMRASVFQIDEIFKVLALRRLHFFYPFTNAYSIPKWLVIRHI